KKAASILNVSALVNKSYKAIIRHFEALARNNKWTNQDRSIWPVSKESLI
ncbi:1094_t:CDS:1, partial [Racocetra persica]